MIHEMADWMFDLPLQDYTLTFDDALYTQYVHFDRLRQIDTDKIFFPSTSIIAPEHVTQSDEFIHCADAHEQLRDTGDLKHYMKWSQLQEIAEDPRCEIGGHSHLHLPYNSDHVMNDTKRMLEEFHKHGFNPTKFCWPYNKSDHIYLAILMHNGFQEFYGGERVSIESIAYHLNGFV